MERADDAEHDADGPPATVPLSAKGEDPAGIPDPMPAELQRTRDTDRAFEESHPMDGEAPSG
jgi:hypothetical protein